MAESWRSAQVDDKSDYNIHPPIARQSGFPVEAKSHSLGYGNVSTVKQLRAEEKMQSPWESRSPEQSVDLEADSLSSHRRSRLDSQSSIVDGLLFEIYDRWHDSRLDSFDSDTFTECSSTSDFSHWRRNSTYQDLVVGGRQIGHLHRAVLEEQDKDQLKTMVTEMQRRINQISAKLVRQLKRRERRFAKLQNNYDILTAVLQASSLKRRIDTRMRFSVAPPPGESAFEQWKDAMKAVARLPLGIPDEFRKKVWLSLAENHIKDLKIDWDKTARFAFNERSNPDDNKLGMQIVKDLHRTGCSGFSGQENEEERVLLKRVLLAYARWNKAVGYCQGFNVIAALLLDVMDKQEGDALKVMIYLIDHVLPQSYFANNLRALSVDMAVFRDLLKVFPRLSKHLDYLQHAQDQASGGCYEPPLTNVFTMQWFLTLFATCLPKLTVLRVWDSIMLEGSEVLLRTALTIWGKLSSRILTVSSADEFYTVMGDLTQEMMEGRILDADSLIKHIYSIAPFPFPQLIELREKYTYNIRPFTPNAGGAAKRTAWVEGTVLPSDEDELDDEDIEAITCFTGFIPTSGGLKSKGLDSDQRTGSVPDISSLGPGAYGLGSADVQGPAGLPAYLERMTTDISALKKQYEKLKQRQAQAHVILATATAKQHAKVKPMVPKIETPVAMNHLFVMKGGPKGKNRFVAAGPRIASVFPTNQQQTGQVNASPKKNIQTVLPPLSMSVKCKPVQQTSRADDKMENAKKVTSHKQTEKKGKEDKEKMSTESLSVKPESDKQLYKNETIDRNLSPSKVFDSGNNTVENSPIHEQVGMEAREECSDTMDNSESVLSPGLEDSGLELSDLSARQQDDSVIAVCTDDLLLEEKCPSVVEGENNDEKHQVDICQENGDNCPNGATSRLDSTIRGNVEIVEKDINCHGNNSGLESQQDCSSTDGETIVDQEETCKSDMSTENLSLSQNFTGIHKNQDLTNSVSDSSQNRSTGLNQTAVLQSQSQTSNVTSDFDLCSNGHCDQKDESNAERMHSKNSKDVSEADDTNDSINPDCDSQINSKHTIVSNTPRTYAKSECLERAKEKPKRRCISEQPKGSKRSMASCSSSGSGTDSDSMLEVFSDNESHSRSFHLYYSNKKSMCSDSNTSSLEAHLQKNRLPPRPFNPFPVKHVNQNRAKTGVKLGLYTQSTLEEIGKNFKR